MEYIIYFEFFGKKMKATIEAESEEKAKVKLRDKINIHKVVKNDQNKELNDLMGMFGIKI